MDILLCFTNTKKPPREISTRQVEVIVQRNSYTSALPSPSSIPSRRFTGVSSSLVFLAPRLAPTPLERAVLFLGSAPPIQSICVSANWPNFIFFDGRAEHRPLSIPATVKSSFAFSSLRRSTLRSKWPTRPHSSKRARIIPTAPACALPTPPFSSVCPSLLSVLLDGREEFPELRDREPREGSEVAWPLGQRGEAQHVVCGF